MNNVKLNQCQDCGCPGSQIEQLFFPVPKVPHRGMTKRRYMVTILKCPYCGRKTSELVAADIAVAFYPNYSDYMDEIDEALINDWNANNRDNMEGLA